jgi:hypothetical protein
MGNRRLLPDHESEKTNGSQQRNCRQQLTRTQHNSAVSEGEDEQPPCLFRPSDQNGMPGNEAAGRKGRGSKVYWAMGQQSQAVTRTAVHCRHLTERGRECGRE